MDVTDGRPEAFSKPFRIERSELNLQLNFATPFWPIANNVVVLYASLLAHLRDFDVTSRAIRPDAADGSLGGFNVNFWMLDFGVLVRIKLDSVELNASNFRVDVDQLEHAFRALDRSLREAQNELNYSSYVVTIGMHGRVDGGDSKHFLEQFTTRLPVELGQSIGSGAIYYFEGAPPATLLSVSADLSSLVAGGIFVKVHSIFDGAMSPDILRSSAESQLTQGLNALGLEVVRT